MKNIRKLIFTIIIIEFFILKSFSFGVGVIGKIPSFFIGSTEIQCYDMTRIADGAKTLSIRKAIFKESESVDLEIPSQALERIVDQILEEAFANSSELKSIILPKTINYIEKGAFSNCVNLEKIKMPNNYNLTLLGDNIFFNCNKLKEIEIPCNLTVKNTFYDCKSLSKVYFNYGVSKINLDNFYNCINLKEIHIPDSVVEIENIGEFIQLMSKNQINQDITFYVTKNSYAMRLLKSYDLKYEIKEETELVDPTEQEEAPKQQEQPPKQQEQPTSQQIDEQNQEKQKQEQPTSQNQPSEIEQKPTQTSQEQQNQEQTTQQSQPTITQQSIANNGQESNQNNNNTTNTTKQGILPFAGVEHTVLIMIVAVAIITIICRVRYNKLKDIEKH